MNGINKGIDFINLTYFYADRSAPKCFIRLKIPSIIYSDIRMFE